MFNLTFEEAIKKCFNKEGFIQGNYFAKGVYVKCDKNNTLVVCESRNLEHIDYPLQITLGVSTQKYRLLTCATFRQKMEEYKNDLFYYFVFHSFVCFINAY